MARLHAPKSSHIGSHDIQGLSRHSRLSVYNIKPRAAGRRELSSPSREDSRSDPDARFEAPTDEWREATAVPLPSATPATPGIGTQDPAITQVLEPEHTAHPAEIDLADEWVAQMNALDEWADVPPDENAVYDDVREVTGAEPSVADVQQEKAERADATKRTSLPTTIKKLNRLLSRQTLGAVPEHELKEQFIRGSGPGGQAINKTSSCVLLTHLPTNLQVRAQPTRSREQNRRAARRIMAEKLDLMISTGLWVRPSDRRSKETAGKTSNDDRLGRGAGHLSGDDASPDPSPNPNPTQTASSSEDAKQPGPSVPRDPASTGSHLEYGPHDGYSRDMGPTESQHNGTDMMLGVSEAEEKRSEATTEQHQKEQENVGWDKQKRKQERKELKKSEEVKLAGQWSKKEIQWEKMRIKKARAQKRGQRNKRDREKDKDKDQDKDQVEE